MLNIGGGELLLILLVALVVLGPDKLPEAARQAGKVMNEFRRMSSGFQTELRNAMKDPVAAALEERQIPSPDPFAAYVRQEEEKAARAAEEEAEAAENGADETESPDTDSIDEFDEAEEADEGEEANKAEAEAAGDEPDDSEDSAEPEPERPIDPEAGIPSDR